MIILPIILAFFNLVWPAEARLMLKTCSYNQECAKNEICLLSLTSKAGSPLKLCTNSDMQCSEINTSVSVELDSSKNFFVFVRPDDSSKKCPEGTVRGKYAGENLCCVLPDTGIVFEMKKTPVLSITKTGDYKLCSVDGSGCDSETEFCSRLRGSVQSSTYVCFQNPTILGDNLKIRKDFRVCRRTEDCRDEELCFEALDDGSGFCVATIISYAYTSVIGADLTCARDPLVDQLAKKSGKSPDFFESFQIAETKYTRVCIIREAMEEACGEPAAIPVKNDDGKFMDCTDKGAMAKCESYVKDNAKGHRAFCGNFERCCKTNLCPGTLFPMAGKCGSGRTHCQRYGWCLAGLCCPHYPLQGTYCSVAKAADVKHQLPVWTFNLTDGSLCSLGHYTWYREKFELRDTCSRELTCPEEDEVCVRTHSVPAWGGHYYMCMVNPLINRSRAEEEKAEKFKSDVILLSISLITFFAIIAGLLWIALH